ncbi:MAG TPA: hypothetical protein VGH87_28390 [Polyangiaceae bacterium]
MTTSSPIPAVRDDDPEDVSWALSTAATQWARGDRVEALKWLRRAAEAASEADKDARALELAKAAADLSTPSMPPPSRPPPSRPPPIVTPKAPPAAVSSRPIVPPPAPSSRPAAIAPRPAPSKPPPQPPKQTAPPKKASTKPPAAGKSAADDTSKRGAVKPRPEMRPRAPLPDEKTDTHVVTEVTRLDAKSPHQDAESWPTESMGAEELDKLHENEQVYGTERTRIGQPAYRPSDPPPGQVAPFEASQAVHVIVWRDGDGRLRVAPRGTTVSAVTIEALLVAPSPDVDLLAWLSPT